MIGRRKQPQVPEGVPAVLPQIIAEVLTEEQVVLTLNGQRVDAEPIRRVDLARTIGELVARLDSPTRIEVRESDGSVYADIITPAPSHPAVAAATPAAPALELVELTADGFVPGEEVAIALVLRHTSATPQGTARALLDRGEHATVTGEVVLIGRISGTTSIQRID